jgi:putative ABC transport system permease protein
MLTRRKFYTIINVVGLSFGLAIVLLISLYVRVELSYEKYNPLADRLVRITMDYLSGEAVIDQDAEMYHPMAPRIMTEFSEVENFARAYPLNNSTIKVGNELFREEKLFSVDPSFLQLFHCTLLSGNRQNVLANPYEVVLTKSMALKYFGKADVVGESISISAFDQPLKVTGLVADAPSNTHFKFNMLVSYASLKAAFGEEGFGWDNNNAYTYLLLTNGDQYEAFSGHLSALNEKLHKEGKILNERVIAQPVNDIHLYSQKSFELEQNGDADSVFFLMGVGILVIVIAVVNYINLSTATSMDRAKEVGIRKVVGSSVRQLRLKFFLESFMINIISGVVALAIIGSVLPGFIQMAGLPADFYLWSDVTFYVIIASAILASSLLSSVFPAVILSRFQPIGVLKGKFSHSTRGTLLRKTLVVFQFAITGFLLIQTVTADRQLAYMRNKDLGLDAERTVVVRSATNVSDEHYQVLKDKILAHPQFESVSLSHSVPGQPTSEMASTNVGVTLVGASTEQSYNFYINFVDADYLSTMKIDLVAGENFTRENTSQDRVVVSEEAIRLWGIPNAQAAIGRKINLWGSQRVIVGVIKNFHQSSPKSPYLPIICFHREGRNKLASIRISNGDLQRSVEVISDTYRSVFPGSPFEYFFLDQEFDKQYRSEEQFQQVFGTLTLFAISISCLGLFGLVSFTVANRTKELGIRKILGASVVQIVTLVSKDFIALVALALAISTTVTFFLVEAWLDRFAFRIDLSADLFIGPVVVALMVSLVTIVARTIGVSLSNPVNALKED